jgi:AbrB family looped-hinge helix DNA binding protein
MKMFAKVSKKGQVTIPKAIREKLKILDNGGVLFLIEDDDVLLQGVPGGRNDELAGSLKQYADNYVALEKVRKKIQGKIARDAARKGLPD